MLFNLNLLHLLLVLGAAGCVRLALREIRGRSMSRSRLFLLPLLAMAMAFVFLLFFLATHQPPWMFVAALVLGLLAGAARGITMALRFDQMRPARPAMGRAPAGGRRRRGDGGCGGGSGRCAVARGGGGNGCALRRHVRRSRHRGGDPHHHVAPRRTAALRTSWCLTPTSWRQLDSRVARPSPSRARLCNKPRIGSRLQKQKEQLWRREN